VDIVHYRCAGLDISKRDESDQRLLEALLPLIEEGPFEIMLANARHVKNLPGRKTDV
jgi:hypothetical protein